jgi:hypothetical protein
VRWWCVSRFPGGACVRGGAWFAKVPGGGPDDAVNKQALDKVFEFLERYFPSGK